MHYLSEHPELTLRPFNFVSLGESPRPVAPWTDKVGGVVMSVRRVPGIIDRIRRAGVPAVNASADLANDFVSVALSADSAAEFAVKHFLELGFRNFAMVTGTHSDTIRERQRAFAAVFAEHGVDLQVREVDAFFTGTFEDFASLAEVPPALVNLIRDAPKPLAVVTTYDRFAAAVCRVVQLLGLAIPDDVGILGSHDTDFARLASPPISSVRTPLERIGYESARLLHRMMLGKRVARRLVQFPALGVSGRESTMGKRQVPATDVQKALAFIRDKACEGIHVEDVAAHVQMALRTFELAFNEAVGHTAGDEIRNARLARAKTLLETTDLALASVAHQTAFSDASSLNRFFHRWMGISATEYRRKFLNETSDE
jgi:LacI family transcriptional regulator